MHADLSDHACHAQRYRVERHKAAKTIVENHMAAPLRVGRRYEAPSMDVVPGGETPLFNTRGPIFLETPCFAAFREKFNGQVRILLVEEAAIDLRP
jgi:hypothetical protein